MRRIPREAEMNRSALVPQFFETHLQIGGGRLACLQEKGEEYGNVHERPEDYSGIVAADSSALGGVST
jgi:hypothetical protein